MGYPERIVPDDTSSGVLALHLARYVFAERWCRDRDVLDVGCGVGYGSAHLADVARRVVGGDVDAESIGYARRRYSRRNVEFHVLDATALPFPDAAFDTVCAFETIEHLADPEALVREAARVLRATGTFLVSTPRVERTTSSPANPHHRVEFARHDFERILGRHFEQVELFGQRRRETARHRALRRLDVLGLRRRSALLRRASSLTGSPATEHTTLADVVIAAGDVEHATELVAVCSRPR
jgi:SAM-dependent methyltransferase